MSVSVGHYSSLASFNESYRAGDYARCISLAADSDVLSRAKNLNAYYDVQEQLYLCNLHLGFESAAKDILAELVIEFGESSSRVQKLINVRSEAVPNKKKVDPSVYKRAVATFRAEQNFIKAVDTLNEYISICPTDFQAWQEMTSLMIEMGNLTRAIYCCDEMILLDPKNEFCFRQRGHLALSTGDVNGAYLNFSRALELSPLNRSSLWGLHAALSRLPALDETATELQKLCKLKLAELYTEKGDTCMSVTVLDILNEAN